MNDSVIGKEELVKRCEEVARDAVQGGYFLNPDTDFTKNLVRGLMVNEQRYGYPACPCRIASGKREQDLDIICPCDYRDTDLEEFGACYCALYVSGEITRGEKTVGPIPERRPPRSMRKTVSKAPSRNVPLTVSLPVWRCRVCGYLCARESPPLVCPICKVAQDRFERFL